MNLRIVGTLSIIRINKKINQLIIHKIVFRFRLLLQLVLLLVPLDAAFSGQPGTPKLVVVISVDQMSPDYFGRFGATWHGGLKKLYTEGSVYTNCSLGYANTETGPGHATIATGCYPSRHGIILNEWFEPTTLKKSYCVDDPGVTLVGATGAGVSPRNLRALTIGDWLKSSSPASRVVSFAIKDRAAILMGGHRSDLTSWYYKSTGKFITSSYYGSTHLPETVAKFNETNFIRLTPSVWSISEGGCDALTAPDSMAGENPLPGETITFPHILSDDNKSRFIQFTPYGDSLTLALSWAAIKDLALGTRDSSDMLFIGLSCTDYIGHTYGPNSVEMCEQMKCLDRYLATYLDSLDSHMGSREYVVVLTSDHSVRQTQEYSEQYTGTPLKRLLESEDVNREIEKTDTLLRIRLRTTTWLVDSRGFLNYRAASDAGFVPDKFEGEVRNEIKREEFVKDVYFRHELLSAPWARTQRLQEFRRSYDPINGPDFVVDVKDNYFVTDSTIYPAHHSRLCTHVPLIFWTKGGVRQKIDRQVMSVDIAPTLARMLNLPSPASVDGRPLVEVIHSRAVKH